MRLWQWASLAFLPTLVIAAVNPPQKRLKEYTWDITWVRAAPDGFARPFVGINGQWPCPAIEGNVGDEIRVKVVNRLGNETTAIHWHGMHQKDLTHMDGPAYVNQCPIPPGSCTWPCWIWSRAHGS